MPKSKLNTEQIIGVLKQVEAGRSVAEVAVKWEFSTTRSMRGRRSTEAWK